MFANIERYFTEGDIGDPTPQFPADPAFTLPHPSQPTGAVERLDDIVNRIRSAAAYTEETGATLGTIPRSRRRPEPEDSRPEITAAVQPGSIIEVRFIRGRSHGVSLQTNADGGGWTDVGRFYMSPAVYKVAPSDAGSPRSVQLRARFLDGNDAVGDWSAIVTVQTIP